MRETTPAAMPPCFERWCSKFDQCFKTKAQRSGFRHYIGGLLGESERKNLTQMANNAVGVTYNRIHHFLTEAQWSGARVNQQRLTVMNKCSQTRISKGFTLIIDDSGHRKSGNFTEGVGRQYIGEIGKTDNGVLTELEQKKLKYLGRVAKNRKVILNVEGESEQETRLDEVAKTLSTESFEQVELKLSKPKKVWVKIFTAKVFSLEGDRSFAIVMNASSFEAATDIDYLMTNVEESKVTAQWVISTYAQRNWVEVFYREVKGWLGFSEYQVRDLHSLYRHFMLVFCAYTFILWHKLTGGLRRRWANISLDTFAEALEAWRTAISYRFFAWLTQNTDVFAAHKANLGFVWA